MIRVDHEAIRARLDALNAAGWTFFMHVKATGGIGGSHYRSALDSRFQCFRPGKRGGEPAFTFIGADDRFSGSWTTFAEAVEQQLLHDRAAAEQAEEAEWQGAAPKKELVP